MNHGKQDLIDRAWLGRALSFKTINDDELALAVAVMSESRKTEIAVRLGKLATDLQDLAKVAAEAERKFLNVTGPAITRRATPGNSGAYAPNTR
jgi:hypothetical protein